MPEHEDEFIHPLSTVLCWMRKKSVFCQYVVTNTAYNSFIYRYRTKDVEIVKVVEQISVIIQMISAYSI